MQNFENDAKNDFWKNLDDMNPYIIILLHDAGLLGCTRTEYRFLTSMRLRNVFLHLGLKYGLKNRFFLCLFFSNLKKITWQTKNAIGLN